LAARLLANGQTVLDVPAELAAPVRVFDTGHGRKTDATDAHSIVMVALRTRGRRQLTANEDLAVLRLLADRRDELSHSRNRSLNQLHRLLAELVPAGAPRHLSALQARTLLASVRPRDLAGGTRRAVAAELIAEVETLDSKLRAQKRRVAEAVTAAGCGLMGIYGVGPAGAARILADVGDVARFPDRNHFASWTGTAPIDASSGEQIRHRLFRAGNRRLNRALHCRGLPDPPRHPRPAGTTSAKWPRGTRRWRHCAACAGDCPMSSPTVRATWPLPHGPVPYSSSTSSPRGCRDGAVDRSVRRARRRCGLRQSSQRFV